MIGRLRGILAQNSEEGVILDVGGVGYLVFCSGRTLARLPAEGEAASLWVETHVREDHIHLYGFLTQAERHWFRLLQTVQGIGAKAALSILTALEPGQLLQAVLAQDSAAIARAQGVGPKLAARVASELKEKALKLPAGSEATAPSPAPAAKGKAAKNAPSSAANHLEEAVSALANLGYSRSDALAAAARASAELGTGAELSELIRHALKQMLPA